MIELHGLMTPRQVAELMGVSPKRVRLWIAEGKLHAMRRGDERRGRLLIPPAAVRDLLRDANGRVTVRPLDGDHAP